MDSFELNKIIGAVLATCILLLVTSFTASALFASKAPEKPGFAIAAKEEGKGGTWTYDDLNQFLTNPKGFIPGTAMGFAGIQKDTQRADVIAYLNSLK